MSEISESAKPKTGNKLLLKLKPSLDSSNNSQKEEELFFSSNCLIMNSNYICKTNPNQATKKGKIFESMDLNIKKKLFSSENANKSDNKKSSEAVSTEPNSIKVKNFNFQKKKFSVIKLVEKGKRSRKDCNRFIIQKNEIEEKEDSNKNKERRDIYGNIISKKNKKNIKVSFIDKVTVQPLVNFIDIECFKKYNYIYGMPKEEKIEKTANCKCCIIF